MQKQLHICTIKYRYASRVEQKQDRINICCTVSESWEYDSLSNMMNIG